MAAGLDGAVGTIPVYTTNEDAQTGQRRAYEDSVTWTKHVEAVPRRLPVNPWCESRRIPSMGAPAISP